LKLASPE
jgi:hypothetical protein